MPIIAAPITPLPAGPALPADQAQATARITTVFDVPTPEKSLSLVVRDGQTPSLAWTMTDRGGVPVDLTSALLDVAGSVVLRVREALACSCQATVEFPGTATNIAAGQVVAPVDLTVLGGPGIFRAEFAVRDADGAVIFQNPFSLTVEPSLYGSTTFSGPPSLAMIRLQLRDSSPAESRLIDTVTFDDAEIAAAITRPIDYWNDALPPLDTFFTTRNFPFRYWWIEATISVLFRMAAEYYRKNHLAYQAGGIAIDDMAKAQEYEQAAELRWQKYEQWVRSRKMAMNLDGCYGTLDSEYSRLGYDHY